MSIKLGTADAAKYLGRSVSTLERWRKENRGPRYTKIGENTSKVLYSKDDLDEFLVLYTVDTKDQSND